MTVPLPLLARSGLLLALLAGEVAFAPALLVEAPQPLLLVVGRRGFRRCRHRRFLGGRRGAACRRARRPARPWLGGARRGTRWGGRLRLRPRRLLRLRRLRIHRSLRAVSVSRRVAPRVYAWARCSSATAA